MTRKKQKTVLLIDGDVLAYRVAAAVEVAWEIEEGYWVWWADEDECWAGVEDEIADLTDKLSADDVVLALSDQRYNFRKDILPTYKHNRANVKRPLVLKAIRDRMMAAYDTYLRPGLEGDDVLGILATWPRFRRTRGNPVIVSIDKDLKTIPCTYVRDLETGPVTISEAEADRWHMIQTLAGDATDGYGGCPGIGMERATKAVEGMTKLVPYEHRLTRGPRKGETEIRYEEVETDDLWKVVVSRFEAAGLDEEEALIQARVARILRASDYDFNNKEPRLWTPVTS